MTEELGYAFFNQDGDVVSVFATIYGKDLDNYLEEQYENDDEPVSEFALDIGLSYYDHDGLEVVFNDDESIYNKSNFDKLLKKGDHYLCSYMEQFGDRLVLDMKKMDISTSTIILLYGFDYTKLRHFGKKSEKVKFVGCYNYIR
jgi:hypothetical protein